MTLGPATAFVHHELSALRERSVAPATTALLDEMLEELSGPLRVAVTGRVNAGKSTLVNALLRQRIAPTDVSECTRYASWFRFGTPERVEVVGPDGTRRTVPMRADGRLPVAIGDLNDLDVARIEVFLSNDSLRNLTLIDTPGLVSSRDDVQRTDQLLAFDRRTRAALAAADALVFVLAGDLRASDEALLDEFRRLTTGLAMTSINSIAVVSRIDYAVEVGRDPIEASTNLVEALVKRLRASVATVLPVVGLLAETADCGVLTDDDLALVATMTSDRAQFDRSLTSVDRFIRSDRLGGDASTRERLLELLDLHGLHLLAERLEHQPVSTPELVDELRVRSGIEAVRTAVIGELTAHADVLKASWALAGLHDLAFRVDPADRSALLDVAEGLELDPVMHSVAEMSAMREVAAEHPDLAAVDVDEIRRLVHGGDIGDRLGAGPGADDSQLRSIALGAVHRWRSTANDATSGPALRHLAGTLARSYELLAAELGGLG